MLILLLLLLVHITYEDGTDRVFRMSAHKIQMLGNHPNESIKEYVASFRDLFDSL